MGTQMMEKMMLQSDADASGTLSLTEWVAFIVGKGVETGKKVLQLYENSLVQKHGDKLDATPAAGLEAECVVAMLCSPMRVARNYSTANSALMTRDCASVS